MTSIADMDMGLRSADESQRWAAAEAAGELLSARPHVVWDLIVVHGSSPNEDTRAAVATCMLEHLLEVHFDEFFPLLEMEIRKGNALLADTLRRCWKLGQAEEFGRSMRWDTLLNFARATLFKKV